MSNVCTTKLNNYLANLMVWTVKLHNYHWNVQGSMFVALHHHTEEVYTQAFENFDEVAEILKMRGEMPLATMKEYLAVATMQETPTKAYSCCEVLCMLEADAELMLAAATDIRNDACANDDFQVQALFEGYVSHFQKQLWFLKAMKQPDTKCC